MAAPIGKGGESPLAQQFLDNTATQGTETPTPLPTIQRPTRPAINFGSMAPMQQQGGPAGPAPSGYAALGYKTLDDRPGTNPSPGTSILVSPQSGHGYQVPTGLSNEALRARISLIDNAMAGLQGGHSQPASAGLGAYSMPYAAAPMAQAAPPQLSQAQMMARAMQGGGGK